MNVNLLVAQCRIDPVFYNTLKDKYTECLDEYIANGGGGIITSASTNGLNVSVAEGTKLEDFCAILAQVITTIETGITPRRVTLGRFKH